MTAVLLVVGLVVLVLGGELLVRGGSGLGRSFGLPPLVVGLTIVAFATSTPELAVSVDASLSGSPGLAVGNVVGSNIVNVLLVLGLAALVLPIAVRSQLVKLDVPIMVAISVLLLVLSLDGSVSRLDGALLLLLAVGYVALSIVVGLREGAKADDAADDAGEGPPRLPVSLALVVVGVALLVLGARALVSGATTLAESFGVSELVIGLTVVAVGTSLPELATSLIAAIRGERELAIGNIVGSNIMNIAAIMGLTAVVSPLGVPVEAAAVRFDMPVMVVVAIALVPVVFTGFVIARWEAAVFLAFYVAYVAYLLLAAADHSALPAFSNIMLLFVAPLTVLTLTVLTAYEVRLHRRRTAAPSG